MVLQRLSTGIVGLDSLIEGGIPKGFAVAIAGNPGTGKTILTSHFLYEGLRNGESGIYVSFGESKEQFHDNIDRVGMDFKTFESENKFVFLDFASITKEGMRDALDEVLATINEIRAKRLVVDSFSAISQAYGSVIDARIVLQTILGKIMRIEGVTSLLIVEIPTGDRMLGSGIEEFVSDGIIRLEHGKDNAIPIILSVVKMRGTAINREPHVCVIGRNGMILYQRQSLKLTYPASQLRVSSGIPGLDERIGNGILRGSTTALIGATGVGKTTFSFQFVANGVNNGEPAIFCTFEESADEIRRMAETFGYNIKELEKKGLHILARNVEDQSPDAFISDLVNEIKITKAKLLVIDSLSSFEHQYKDKLYLITKALGSLVRQQEVTAIFTILTTQQSGFMLSDLGISSLFQNIFMLRYAEAQTRMKRFMIVLKMRSTRHDESIIEFKITSGTPGKNDIKGIRILSTDDKYVGIMTGNAQILAEQSTAREKEISDRDRSEREHRVRDFEANEQAISDRQRNERQIREKGYRRTLRNGKKSANRSRGG